MRNNYIFFLLCFFSIQSWSQEYRNMIAKGNYSVYEIIAEAESYFSKVGKGRGTGYKPYKRWE